jgi:NADP-dependent 3-hydroxy acid dehydrogenase YdfG
MSARRSGMDNNIQLVARRVDRIKALADELTRSGGTALAMATDVTHVDQVKKLVDAAVQAFGRVGAAPAKGPRRFA